MEHHPSDLDTFYAKHPSFIWGPLALTVAVRVLCAMPFVATHLAKLNASPYGIVDAGVYAAFAVVLSYAVHGWMCTHLSETNQLKHQLQSYERTSRKPNGVDGAKRAAYVDKIAPAQEATRTVAALLTSLVYAVYPFAPATATWASFVAWTIALAIYWDLHFYICHRIAHEWRPAYAFFHKLHHENKQPGPFNAYFVTYQSHVLLEHVVVLIVAMCGLPRDVFTWTLWWGTLGTYVEHAGHDMDSLKLPLVGKLGVTWGLLSTALAPWSLLLGGESTAEHDWHHEKFTANYSLSFKYLDKLLGTYHPGRNAGDAIKPKVPVVLEAPQCGMKAAPGADGDVDGPLYRMMPVKMPRSQENEDEGSDMNAPAPCMCSGLEFD